ncbi:hypothetical protein GGX14DRAFT_408391 [Mycena pura]|uniref:Uncharacterized protein n=1 Tax=Mycena pura TaxID=153505 RepID=A0AAD6UL27_9AGAR|nr:hypothetical protein GGX14DRAFT_408391 [Mycena pura]
MSAGCGKRPTAARISASLLAVAANVGVWCHYSFCTVTAAAEDARESAPSRCLRAAGEPGLGFQRDQHANVLPLADHAPLNGRIRAEPCRHPSHIRGLPEGNHPVFTDSDGSHQFVYAFVAPWRVTAADSRTLRWPRIASNDIALHGLAVLKQFREYKAKVPYRRHPCRVANTVPGRVPGSGRSRLCEFQMHRR